MSFYFPGNLPVFQTGYILNRNWDLVWFVGLPFVATVVALLCQQWLTGAALVAFSLWITFPHHFAGWIRTYGIAEERQRWSDRLIVGPAVLLATCIAGLRWAPVTTALLVLLWDHQHSLMQQHGFARIYDFKGRTGAPSTGRFDLWLSWILFGNMLLTSPLLMPVLIRELYRFRLPVSRQAIEAVQLTSWGVTGIFLAVYLGHLVWCVRHGYRLNPIKYVFIASSYFLWYFCAWQSANVLVFGIAHRIMHGVQYSVIVYWYLRKQTQGEQSRASFAGWLVRPGHVAAFVLTGLIYSALFHGITGGALGDFGFGVIEFPRLYQAIPNLGLSRLSPGEGYALVSAAMIEAFALTHYYFDSFIWKVSDRRTQAGLS